METQTFTPVDLVNYALAKDAVKVSAAMDQELGQRVYDAIQSRKQEIAAQMFAEPVDAAAEQEQEEPIEAEAEEVAVADAEQQSETEESDEAA